MLLFVQYTGSFRVALVSQSDLELSKCQDSFSITKMLVIVFLLILIDVTNSFGGGMGGGGGGVSRCYPF